MWWCDLRNGGSDQNLSVIKVAGNQKLWTNGTLLLKKVQRLRRNSSSKFLLLCFFASVPLCFFASVLLCLCASLPLCFLASVPLCLCASVLPCLCASLPLCFCAFASVPLCLFLLPKPKYLFDQKSKKTKILKIQFYITFVLLWLQWIYSKSEKITSGAVYIEPLVLQAWFLQFWKWHDGSYILC